MLTKNIFNFRFFNNRRFFILFLILNIVIFIFLVIQRDFKIPDIKKVLGVGLNIWIILAILIILAFIISVIILYKLYKLIINPLNDLYWDISEIGMTGPDYKVSKTNDQDFIPTIFRINLLFKKLKKLKNLIALMEKINKSESFDKALESAFSYFSEFIPYQYIGIALLSEDGKTLEAFHGISDGTVKGLPQSLLEYKVNIGDTSLTKIMETGIPRIINDLEKYTKGVPLKAYNKILLECGIKSSVTHLLKINDRPMGFIFFSSIYKNVYNKSHISFLNILADSIAICFSKNILIDNILYSSTLALAKLAESRDKDTGEHLQRIGTYSRVISKLLFSESIYKEQISLEYLKDIEAFSPLHDIGKVAIQDNILLKPGKLTKKEFEIMKTHACFGARILKEADDNIKTSRSSRGLFQMGIEIAEGHHEKWDGTGYPFEKKGEEIPLCARIVALADVFDALTNKRPYKEAFSFEKALNIISQGSGSHFDPEIVRVFLKNEDKIYEIYQQFYRDEKENSWMPDGLKREEELCKS